MFEDWSGTVEESDGPAYVILEGFGGDDSGVIDLICRQMNVIAASLGILALSALENRDEVSGVSVKGLRRFIEEFDKKTHRRSTGKSR